MSTLGIPEAAIGAAWHELRYPRPATDAPSESLKRALAVAAPLIVAAEIASDEGLEVLCEAAVRVDSDSDAMALVGAVLRYVDDRRRRAAELRGEDPNG